jgi:hypothetical protein
MVPNQGVCTLHVCAKAMTASCALRRRYVKCDMIGKVVKRLVSRRTISPLKTDRRLRRHHAMFRIARLLFVVVAAIPEKSRSATFWRCGGVRGLDNKTDLMAVSYLHITHTAVYCSARYSSMCACSHCRPSDDASPQVTLRVPAPVLSTGLSFDKHAASACRLLPIFLVTE